MGHLLADALADLLRRLGNLADPVQVVTDWKEIEQGVLGNGHFPPARLKKKAPATATTTATAGSRLQTSG